MCPNLIKVSCLNSLEHSEFQSFLFYYGFGWKGINTRLAQKHDTASLYIDFKNRYIYNSTSAPSVSDYIDTPLLDVVKQVKVDFKPIFLFKKNFPEYHML